MNSVRQNINLTWLPSSVQYGYPRTDQPPSTSTSTSTSAQYQCLISDNQWRTKTFHDELSSDCRLADPMQAFKVDVFYKLVDVAINQLEWRFEEQRNVADLFKFLFPDVLL